ncbi:hypothetical protein EUGRSUZ_G00779 [Eucalyptus grandis]|uniref:Uncharacterized protein n=2 Tax=Eucalyptus grandis TaxID=71139 RepID=A0ACC3K0H0_EUCGR|nr:hypothetical protein EUGRSUZ_G00779 [Eucalyptus grandis]
MLELCLSFQKQKVETEDHKVPKAKQRLCAMRDRVLGGLICAQLNYWQAPHWISCFSVLYLILRPFNHADPGDLFL